MKKELLFYLQIVAYAISSVAIAFSGLGSDALERGSFFGYLIGLFFWIGLISGIVFTVLLSQKRKKAGFTEGKIGVIHFFDNTIAIVFDVLCALSLIGSIIVAITKSESFIGFIIIALLFFSFEMHCIFNGKNYKYLRQKNLEEKNNG